MNALDLKVLPFSSKARICWGFFWRGIAVSLGSALSGGLLGGIAGFILGYLGVPDAAAPVGGVLGLACGAFFLYLFLRWILVSRIGNFKFVLVHSEEKL